MDNPLASADMKAVRAAAISAAGEILRDAGNKCWSGEEWQMHVTDETNKTVLKLVFSAGQMSQRS